MGPAQIETVERAISESSPINGRSPGRCSRCEQLPAALPGSGTLYLAPPLAHSLGTARRVLREAGVPTTEPGPGLLAVPIESGTLAALVERLATALSAVELADSRSVLVPTGSVPGIGDLLRAESLSALVARVRGAWVAELLAEDRLTTHFQPIVRCAVPDQVYGHECLLRGVARDGALILPRAIYDAAAGAGLLFPLDLAARRRAIRAVRDLALPTAVFINFLPTAIYDPTYCLRSTIRAIGEAGIPPDRVVFEVVESAAAHDPEHLLGILRGYRAAGFRVALDDLGAGYGSLNLLAQLRPDFVKLDIELTRGIDHDPFRATLAAKLLEAARDLGIGTVAEGVETAAEWRWLRDHGADYAQGYLFGRPAYPPPTPIFPE